MRGQSLLSILKKYRSEIRASQNAAHNIQVREQQVDLLQRTQERLWEGFDWPHMITERDYPLVTGQSLYDVSGDFDVDRIGLVALKDGAVWRPLSPTLTPYDYSVWDSQLGQKSWPVQRWRIFEGERLEFWPAPDRAGNATTQDAYFKIRGVRRLKPFIADDDIADLDDTMIALFAAAETLAAAGAKDAQLKLSAAQAHQMRLQGHLAVRRNFRLGEAYPLEGRSGRRYVNSYRPPGT